MMLVYRNINEEGKVRVLFIETKSKNVIIPAHPGEKPKAKSLPGYPTRQHDHDQRLETHMRGGGERRSEVNRWR